MTIIWTGLAPHPPIIVRSVGGARCREAQHTIDNMDLFAEDLLSHRPDRVVLISPHTPRPKTGIAAWFGDQLSGDFSRFGAPQTRLRFPLDRDWLNSFIAHYSDVSKLTDEPLDHGAAAPLYFLDGAGWRGPTVVLGLPWDEGGELDRIGSAINACDDDKRTALIASGDMSHCLKEDGPYGFDSYGPIFDEAFVSHLKIGDYRGALNLDWELRQAARQDVVESCRVVWAASDFDHQNHHFYHYEGPFGVGYTVMRFRGES